MLIEICFNQRSASNQIKLCAFILQSWFGDIEQCHKSWWLVFSCAYTCFSLFLSWRLPLRVLKESLFAQHARNCLPIHWSFPASTISVTNVWKKYFLHLKTPLLMEALNPLIRVALELESLLLAWTELTGLINQVCIRICACFADFIFRLPRAEWCLHW